MHLRGELIHCPIESGTWDIKCCIAYDWLPTTVHADIQHASAYSGPLLDVKQQDTAPSLPKQRTSDAGPVMAYLPLMDFMLQYVHYEWAWELEFDNRYIGHWGR